MGYRYIKHLSPEGRRALAEFWRVLDEHREEVDAAVREVAQALPAFSSILTESDPHEEAERSANERRLERAALRDGEWDGYLANLRTRGVTYAQMGIELRDWFELLGAYRQVVLRRVLPDGSARPARVLEGMGHFLDIAMATIGSAYVETKEAAAHQAQQQLGLYVDMIQKAPVGMLMYACEDPTDVGNFRLVAVNPAATRMIGLDLAERVGMTIREAAPDMLDGEAVRYFAATLETGVPQRWFASVGDPPNQINYRSQTVLLDGEHLGVLFEDVTERERHLREIERSNRELDEFAYVASHDLKAPLRDIENLAGWLVEDEADTVSDTSRRHLEQLRDRVGRMERLLEDLLAYSRAGRGAAAPESFTLREVIDDAASMAGIPAGFELEVDEGDVLVSAPRTPLEQVLRNLLSNCVKHHQRGSGHIRVSVTQRSNELELAVADDGPGIPDQFRERVFRMFQTLRPRDDVEGSGMGLAIVKKLVETHGGKIALESAPGQGTTVRFTWPTSPTPGVPRETS